MFACKWQGPLAVVGIMTLVCQKVSCDKMVGESAERQTSAGFYFYFLAFSTKIRILKFILNEAKTLNCSVIES